MKKRTGYTEAETPSQLVSLAGFTWDNALAEQRVESVMTARALICKNKVAAALETLREERCAWPDPERKLLEVMAGIANKGHGFEGSDAHKLAVAFGVARKFVAVAAFSGPN